MRMSSNKGKICRFCLRTLDDVFEIDKMTKEIIDLLLLKFDFNNIELPVMCYECATMLQKAFEFKSTCIYTEDCIFPFSNSKNNSKVTMQEVYLKINENETINDIKNLKVCRFCMKLEKSMNCRSTSEIVENTLINRLLEEHFPEIILNSTENPIICENCFNFLHLFLIFVTTLSDTEEKIKLYIGSEDYNGQVNLRRVPQFLLQPAIKDTCAEVNGHQTEQAICKVDEEDVLCKKKDDHFTEMQNWNVKTDETKIKLEGESKSSSNDEMLAGVQGQNSDDKTKIQSVDIKSEKTITKRKRFKCKCCTFKTKNRQLFREHQLNHKGIWSCDLCDYNTMRQRGLDQHMLIHKDPSEVTMFKCDKCEYESRRKKDLRNHKQTHRNDTQIPVYDCPLCAYTANCRQNMNKHLVNHKNSAGMYKCKDCTYLSKSAYNIRKHNLIHTDAAKCELCSFKTKYKDVLTNHMLIHHTPSPKLPIFNCGICAFQTYSKNSLRDHKRRLHDSGKISLHQCDTCGYVTKNSGHLKQHMLSHKDAAQVTMFKCELCSHETRYKSNFTKHMNRHKRKSKKNLLKHEKCVCKMEREEDFKNHMLTQKTHVLLKEEPKVETNSTDFSLH